MKNKNEIILSAQNVHKNYIMGKSLVLKVLKNIDLNIMRGEILSVICPSGVGKSTLLHILGALDRPTSGKIVLDDVNVFTMRNDQMANFRNKQVGFVFQFYQVFL